MGEIVCVTGLRDLHPGDLAPVELTICEYIADGAAFVVGGARGCDTSAMAVLREFALEVRLTVVLPGTRAQMPAEPRAILDSFSQSVRVVELGLPLSRPDSYLKRNQYMLDMCTQVLAFSDDRETGGTWWTINRARARGSPVGRAAPSPTFRASSRLEAPTSDPLGTMVAAQGPMAS